MVGQPRATCLPFALPDITGEEIDAVVETLRSGWLTTGPRVKAFEQAFADYLGVSHAIALNSGTAALHLALEAIGLSSEQEVIVPTFTFTASAEVVRYFGARPVLVDVDPLDLNLDVAAVERAITPKTRAIIGVDFAGQPCDWARLKTLTDGGRVVLIDDAAHALPSWLQGVPIGKWADLTAFSFYATKTLTTGEGGMLVTERKEWADRVEIMSLHGISKNAWNRYTVNGSWFYEVMAPGYKYNMTDIAAALGLVQLRRLETMSVRRAEIARKYTAAFERIFELEVPRVKADRSSSWHLYVLRLNLERLRCDRGAFIEALHSENIASSVHFIPLHRHPYYADGLGFSVDDFPTANREYWRVVSLPIYSRMTDADVEDVIEAVIRVVRANAK
jgi:dTDP-4-amino-4,6-dideoxygalactose transaminase